MDSDLPLKLLILKLNRVTLVKVEDISLTTVIIVMIILSNVITYIF